MVRRRGGSQTAAVRKGPWTPEEDEVVREHVRVHGPKDWSSIQAKGLLPRTGKSCRLRWVNKLRSGLMTGCKFSAEEEDVVIKLQAQFGNKWAKIATFLTGRTDNDVKNFWSTRQKKLARMLKAAPPSSTRRSSGKQIIGSSWSHMRLATPMEPSMVSSQETTYHVGESSNQARVGTNNCTDSPLPQLPAPEPLPGLPAPEPPLPSSVELAMVPASECSSYSNHLSFGDAVYPALLMVYPATFGDMASADEFGDDVACYLEPILEFEPIQFFGPGDCVVFDELSPETLDFFDRPPSPPPPPPIQS